MEGLENYDIWKGESDEDEEEAADALFQRHERKRRMEEDRYDAERDFDN